MEIILDMMDIGPRGRGKLFSNLDISDFQTIDLKTASYARKIIFVHGKENIH